MELRKFLFLLWVGCGLTCSTSYAQRLPLDFALATDIYTQKYLLDGAPVQSPRGSFSDSVYLFGDYHDLYYPVFAGLTPAWLSVRLLPLEWLTEYNSRHPYGWNNGSMLRSRGLQSLLRTGVWVKLGILEIQAQPEIVYSAQKAFDGFPQAYTDRIWARRYANWSKIDLPERWQNKAPTELLAGQSQVNLNIKGVLIGLSNRNFWMGPGIHQSLLMTNNARAFPRLFIETEQPLSTLLGSFYFHLWGGLTQASNETMSFKEGVTRPSDYRKPDRDRYVNGVTISYEPAPLKGLVLGVNRVYQLYTDLAQETSNFIPVFGNLFRQNDNVTIESEGQDQLISVFARLALAPSHTALSIEYGRNDASLNLRDFLMSPSHSFAYNFALTQYVNIDPYRRLLLQIERTRFESVNKRYIRTAGSWYEHSQIVHGYTQYGEILGSGIGVGSNLTFTEVSLLQGHHQIGLTFEYLQNDKNFRVERLLPRNNWITLATGAQYKGRIANLWIESQLKWIRDQNYQWLQSDETEGTSPFQNNFHARIKIAYVLRK